MKEFATKNIWPWLKNNPMALVIFGIISFTSLWGYYNVMAAVDKKADSATVMLMQTDIAHVKGRIDQVLNVLTGKPVNGEHPKIPPPHHLVGADSVSLVQSYDSCKCGYITDSTATRPPWHCWYKNSNGLTRMRTFK